MKLTFGAAIVAFTCVLSGVLCAQESPTATADAVGSVAVSVPTAAEIKSFQQEINDNAELTDEVKRAALEALQKAADHVVSAEKFSESLTRLQQELNTLPQQVARLEAAMKQPLSMPSEENTDVPTATSELQLLEKQGEVSVTALTAELAAIESEISRRNERRPLLPELIATVSQQVPEAKTQLAALNASEDAKSTASTARRVQLTSRLHRLTVETGLLEQESRTFEAAAKLWSVKRDDADRRLVRAKALVAFWQAKVAAARQREAEREATNAKAVERQFAPAVRTLAEENSALAIRNAALVKSTSDLKDQVTGIRKRGDDRQTAFTELQNRAVAANYSQAIGVLLRIQQASLPRSESLQVDAQTRQRDITQGNVDMIEWESSRRRLLDIGAAVTTSMREVELTADIDGDVIRQQVAEILTTRRDMLADLIGNGKLHLDELVRLDSLQKRFIKQLDSERSWLAEHVLWVRSTGFLGSQPRDFSAATRALADGPQWRQSINQWIAGAMESRFLLLSAVFPFILLLSSRPAMKRELRALGTTTAKHNCVEFAPTLKAIGLTLLIALPMPAMALFVGWVTASFGHGFPPLLAFGRSLQLVGVCWFAIEFIRQLVAAQGVAEAHLGWPAATLLAIRSAGRLLLLTQLTPILISGYTEFIGDETLISTFGRVSFLVAMIGAAAAFWRLLNPNGTAINTAQSRNSFLWNSRWLWASIAMLAPVVLATLSVLGFHYTAVRLTGRVAATLSICIAALFVAALLTRWLLIVYRRLSIRRARERRQQQLEAAEGTAETSNVVPQIPEVRLDDVNQQTRRLIRIGCSVVSIAALYLVWIDVTPAFGFLNNIELWEDRLATLNEGEPQPWVTAGDLLMFLIVAGLTLVASRNIPGFMEITVLQRLPMDAGARYAASMISRYLIIVSGFLLAFTWIGIGWSSVQWLVAAMTVGLGFGLQEIFANFVSGIILLFERPVRVGDTVTISDITGTVTRIQIRATTLLDWDNKELIVPNREFVTGHLVNWTLSNPTLRLNCVVGVSYGSDTRLVTELLYKVAANEPEVLETPEPVVVFEEFGDNSLNFHLRIFVNGLHNFRRLKHKINLAIDDEFRRQGIEIAYPQHDLHIRSMPDGLAEALRQVSKQSALDVESQARRAVG